MSCSIDLGQKLFSSSASDLTLSLQASASMLLPPGRPDLHDLERLKELLFSGNIWVSQAPELRLDVRITSVPDLHPYLARFVSRLGDSICKAKMWSDLELSISYKSCVYEPEQTFPAYILSFGIQSCLGHVQRRTPTLPKVLREVSDAIPPDGVPAVRITSVVMRMEYNHNNHECIRSSQQGWRNGGHIIIQPTQFNDRTGRGVHHPPDGISTTIEAENRLLKNDAEAMSEGWEHPDYSILGTSPSSEFGVLFQEGLKILVFGDTAQRRRKSRTKSDDFKSLSRIAPSVFKLSYREAMNQRSRLMPSIAKSLASMLEHSDDQTLKDKLAVIETAPNSNSRSPASSAGGNSAKATIKARLWTIAQKRLYSAPIPKHSRPPSDHVLGPDRDDEAWDENLFSEIVTEELAYIIDDPVDAVNGLDFHSEICSDGNEHYLDFDVDEAEEETHSMMILEDFHTENSESILRELPKDLALRANSLGPSIDKITLTPPHTSTSSIPLSFGDRNETSSDHEMLVMDSDSAEDFPSLSSQAFSPYSHYVYDRSRIDLRADDISPNQAYKSFRCSENLDWELLAGENEDGYDIEMLCDNL
ncbi:hypothetical protein BDW75DRAFT_207783 [Aspergillus navahoensis]